MQWCSAVPMDSVMLIKRSPKQHYVSLQFVLNQTTFCPFAWWASVLVCLDKFPFHVDVGEKTRS